MISPNLRPHTLSFLIWSIFIVICITNIPVVSIATETDTATQTSIEKQLPENFTESQVDTILAGMDDTMVRQMLIDELKKDAQQPQEVQPPKKGKRLGARLARWLGTMEDESDEAADRMTDLSSFLPYVIPNIKAVYAKAVPEGRSLSVVQYILSILAIVIGALLLERWLERTMTRKYFPTDITPFPAMGGPAKLISGFMRIIPEIIGLIFFVFASYSIYYFIFDTEYAPARLLFLAFLIFVTFVRLISIFSQLICSPTVSDFRLIPLSDDSIKVLHKSIIVLGGYILAVMLFSILTRALGANVKTVIYIQMFSATLLIAASMLLILIYRKTVAGYIVESGDINSTTSWAKKGFASIWHILAIIYFFIIWNLMINDFSYLEYRPGRGAFLLSFFVVPVWFIFNSLGLWVVNSTMRTLKLHQSKYDDEGEEVPEEELKRREEGRILHVKVSNISRIVVMGIVVLWLAQLWGFELPFLFGLAGILFDALIILTLALLTWQVLSSWIEKKIEESLPEEEEEEDDSEWGGAANRGRSYTLLPMIRKFIGTVLVVMVALTLLSSMGVEIGPLLAGAGVIGLAIGFGAQKLVSDVFSGFFYLLDDAFRVGEYLTAGSVSGSVESITLRNVMLRHHRGMLQIVPHSELGAITNFMRGGMIVKFSLDFPYDADIDKIRKIIKKVGQAMLEDEDFGKDFIRPVKSQGVREITNSVMTIRAKFTAQPGTHFVIRREAYRRITEALAAQGIHYAHRKVIVDLPQPVSDDGKEGEVDRAGNAAGAAAMAVIQQEEEALLKAKPQEK